MSEIERESPAKIVEFNYMNHRGEIRIRRIKVLSLDFLVGNNYGYQPGWFITGIDLDKNERRSFALSRIIFNEGCASIIHLNLAL